MERSVWRPPVSCAAGRLQNSGRHGDILSASRLAVTISELDRDSALTGWHAIRFGQDRVAGAAG